jgi:hypothetical protein
MADGQVRPERGVHAGCGLGGSIRGRTKEEVHTSSLLVTEKEQLAVLIRARH